MAADGSYASRDNLDQAKARGVSDVAFHKKRGLAVADMAKSARFYRRLRNCRAGIEAGISCFKRASGGGRCTWRGLDHFKAYVWSAVVAHNLCCSPASNRDKASPLPQHRNADHLNPARLPVHVNRVPSHELLGQREMPFRNIQPNEPTAFYPA
jgi:hypothetical protein